MAGAWQRARDGFRGVDRGELRRFLAWLAVGLIVSSAATAALTFGASRLDAHGAFAWERAAMLAMERELPMSFQQALFLQALGSSALIFPIAIAGAWLAARAHRPLEALAVLAAAFPIKIVVLSGWLVWARERPDFIAEGIAVPTSLHAFPSGHLAQTVVLYGLLASFVWRISASAIERSLAVLATIVIVFVVGVARVRMGTHWPSDLAGGAFAGAMWLGSIIVALRRAERG